MKPESTEQNRNSYLCLPHFSNTFFYFFSNNILQTERYGAKFHELRPNMYDGVPIRDTKHVTAKNTYTTSTLYTLSATKHHKIYTRMSL